VPVFGAVSVEASPRWHNLFAERLNGVTFLKFLRQVLRWNPGRKVFMVLDNVGYHHSRDVKAWLELRKDQIELFFLPAYSPEFNPVETVWKHTKRTSTHNRHFKRQQELRTCLERRFNRYQGNRPSLRGIVARFMPSPCQSRRT
jgi:putative transposase